MSVEHWFCKPDVSGPSPEGGFREKVHDYDAYGKLLDSSLTPLTNWLFGGDGIYDPSSGWTYHLARWRDGQRFVSYDSFEADPSSPASLHKYLYVGANPGNMWDPSGNSYVDVMCSMGTLLILYSMQLAPLYNASPEVVTNMLIVPTLNNAYSAAFGVGENGETIGYGERAMLGGLVLFDIVGGQLVERLFPTQSLSKITRWVRVLLEEHAADAPATRRAMAAALQFSEKIEEGSIRVKGAGVVGADITAVTAEGKTLAREVTVFQSKNVNNLYGKLIREGAQVTGYAHQQIFVQVTEEVLQTPNAAKLIRENASAAVKDFKELYGRDVKVIVVDHNAVQIFPQ